MWYNLRTLSGKHYGFKAMGFNTRYTKGFQVYIDSLSELNRLVKIFDGGVMLNTNNSILILDGEYWLDH